MRIVPRRVVCYYKFNVKSWSKKMREGGFGIWNGSIHLPFLLVSKCAQRRREKKKTTQWKLSSKGKNHFIPGNTAKNISLPVCSWWLCWARLYCIYWWRYERAILCTHKFTFLLSSERENSIWFLTVIYRCAFFFSLHHSRWKLVCDHGQHFPFLKCLLLLLPCQFVSEENDSWKTPLFGFALSMETGP